MKMLERQIKHVKPGMVAEWLATSKKWDTIESTLGYPPKKCFQLFCGGQATDTVIIEREWESMAAMESAYQKSMADPRTRAISEEQEANLASSSQIELYIPLT